MSGVKVFGPLEENSAISGAGLVKRTVIVWEILAIGFLQMIVKLKPADLLTATVIFLCSTLTFVKSVPFLMQNTLRFSVYLSVAIYA